MFDEFPTTGNTTFDTQNEKYYPFDSIHQSLCYFQVFYKENHRNSFFNQK